MNLVKDSAFPNPSHKIPTWLVEHALSCVTCQTILVLWSRSPEKNLQLDQLCDFSVTTAKSELSQNEASWSWSTSTIPAREFFVYQVLCKSGIARK